MNTRLTYAIPMTVFALFTGFYAVMTLAFFFGEGHYDAWLFPVFITALAAISIWSAAALWRKRESLVPTLVSLLGVFGVCAWIATPPFTIEPAFIGIVLVGLVALGMLLGLSYANIRTGLRA